MKTQNPMPNPKLLTAAADKFRKAMQKMIDESNDTTSISISVNGGEEIIVAEKKKEKQKKCKQ